MPCHSDQFWICIRPIDPRQSSITRGSAICYQPSRQHTGGVLFSNRVTEPHFAMRRVGRYRKAASQIGRSRFSLVLFRGPKACKSGYLSVCMVGFSQLYVFAFIRQKNLVGYML